MDEMKKIKGNASQEMRLGYNIRKWRELKGVKQSRLAKQLGITCGALSNIENDKTNPTLQRITQIANCLDLDVVKLFNNPLDLLSATK